MPLKEAFLSIEKKRALASWPRTTSLHLSKPRLLHLGNEFWTRRLAPAQLVLKDAISSVARADGRTMAEEVKEQVKDLMKATVLMRHPQQVQEIICSLRKGGPNKLQVISDFDMTLTRFGFNGKRCPTSYNILDNSKLISEDCQKKLKDLLHYYYPIEIDPNRTVKEKFPLMVEWWTKAHNLLCQQKIQKYQISQIVRDSDAMLREGFETFFNTLYRSNVPLLIFSAGIGDILEEIIRQMNVFHPNIHVVSNYMDFDESSESQLTSLWIIQAPEFFLAVFTSTRGLRGSQKRKISFSPFCYLFIF
ncbi:7-methylguanosine phosphate-specific 5'-nucleotidase isoform X2 [Sarcophilus harrisii]|uniref:7-methylguanosine phosphate-specific 5'-nucleotidase isoform X2 n=1 Tax=Sarcophilus harrisii TaxID=9305 RepID=UPI001301C961|nr:7-methylguanosine phosphate-specific 5'-nucleotidase isoform X2 [Sarcophilus harrisii]